PFTRRLPAIPPAYSAHSRPAGSGGSFARSNDTSESPRSFSRNSGSSGPAVAGETPIERSPAIQSARSVRRIRASLSRPAATIPAAVLLHVGRALQLFGLILLPAALLYGMTSSDKSAVGIELACLALG